MSQDSQHIIGNYCKKITSSVPLVSVITVVRNCSLTIENTILSVIKQENINIEYIIIDGISTDGTVELIRKHEDSIDYWISESDKGIYDAMNKGILLAKGHWIIFMNSGDTFVADNTLQEIFKRQFDDNLDIIYGDTVFDYLNKKMYVIPQKLDNIEWNLPFCHQSVFVKRLVLNENLFDLNFKIAADYAQFLSLFRQKKIFQYIPLAVANYALEGGVSSRNTIRLFRELTLISGKQKNIEYYLRILKLMMRTLLFFFVTDKIIMRIRLQKYFGDPRFKILDRT